MAIKLQHLRSSVAGKAPQAADLDVGQIAVNFNDSDPALYIKDSAGSVVRIAGGGAAGGLWTRSGTELSPNTAGDSVFTSGDVKVGNTTAAPNISLNADGSATFAGTVIAGEDPTAGVGVGVSIASGGYYQACRSSGLIFRGYTQGNTTATSQLNADGSATFATAANLQAMALWENGAPSNQTVLGIKRGAPGGSFVEVFKVNNQGTISAGNTTIQPISSERRLKENIVAVDSDTAWKTVKETPFYQYNFIGSPSASYGPMADEVPDDMRIATDRSDDVGVIHTYDNGMLQARLYTALQTALTRIEALEAKLAALEGGTN
jgi:hypothetical protein